MDGIEGIIQNIFVRSVVNKESVMQGRAQAHLPFMTNYTDEIFVLVGMRIGFKRPMSQLMRNIIFVLKKFRAKQDPILASLERNFFEAIQDIVLSHRGLEASVKISRYEVKELY